VLSPINTATLSVLDANLRVAKMASRGGQQQQGEAGQFLHPSPTNSRETGRNNPTLTPCHYRDISFSGYETLTHGSRPRHPQRPAAERRQETAGRRSRAPLELIRPACRRPGQVQGVPARRQVGVVLV
jgi:hypothetical protein